jgi:hypothetical protein
MKMRSTIRALTRAGAIAAATAGIAGFSVTASAALTFGNWSVTNGDITPGCPSGASCSPALVTGKGFLQRQVNEGDQAYFQTIITDANASSASGVPFADESFVKFSLSTGGQSSTQGGIMDQMSLTDSANGLVSTSSLRTGSFGDGSGGNPEISLSQAVTDEGDAAGRGDNFSTSFMFNRNQSTDAAGNTTVHGTRIDITQGVGLDTAVPQNPASQGADWGDWTEFALTRISGDMSTQSGSATLPVGVGQSNSTTRGGTINWSPGDDIIVTWIGQRITIGTADVGLGIPGVQTAAYQAVENVTNSEKVDTFSFGTSDSVVTPVDWGTGSGLEGTIGPAPVLGP